MTVFEQPPHGRHKRDPLQSNSDDDEHWVELAHHIRTPLNTAKGVVYHLKNARDLSMEETSTFIDLLAQEIDRLALVLEKELSSRRKNS